MQLAMLEVDLMIIQTAECIRRCVHMARNTMQFSYELLQLFALLSKMVVTTMDVQTIS